MTVSGLTMTTALRHRGQMCDNQPKQPVRPAERQARVAQSFEDVKLVPQRQISTCRAARDRSDPRSVRRNERSTAMRIRLPRVNGKLNRCNENGIFVKHE
jgi:hypothetical protein